MKKSILAILIILSTGCTHDFFGYKARGDQQWQYAFETLPEAPMIHEVVALKEVTVHIVGDPSQFPWIKKHPGAVGFATTGNEVWILGRMINGQIIVNQAVMGHELNHLLNFENPSIANPDELKGLIE